MNSHNADTVLVLTFSFYKREFDTWFLNKSERYIEKHQSHPRRVIVPMRYSMMSGDYVDMTPDDTVDISMCENTVYLNLSEDHVNLTLSVTTEDMNRQFLKNIDQRRFALRKMTLDNKYMVELLLMWHGGLRFTIHGCRIQCHRDTCRFDPTQCLLIL